jgi:hypothetical protein
MRLVCSGVYLGVVVYPVVVNRHGIERVFAALCTL